MRTDAMASFGSAAIISKLRCTSVDRRTSATCVLLSGNGAAGEKPTFVQKCGNRNHSPLRNVTTCESHKFRTTRIRIIQITVVRFIFVLCLHSTIDIDVS